MFNNNQCTEIVLLYPECHQNKQKTARQYTLKFPGENHPSSSTVLRVMNCLKEAGRPSLIKKYHGLNSVSAVEDVLGYVLGYP